MNRAILVALLLISGCATNRAELSPVDKSSCTTDADCAELEAGDNWPVELRGYGDPR